MVATLFDVLSETAHAVLYDENETLKQKDGNYHFKNSHPQEPYIVVPKNRMTYLQFKELKTAKQQGHFVNTKTNLEQVLGENILADLQPNQTYWTICDKLFAVSIIKK